MVEEAGQDFEGDGVLQVDGREAAGMRGHLIMLTIIFSSPRGASRQGRFVLAFCRSIIAPDGAAPGYK